MPITLFITLPFVFVCLYVCLSVCLFVCLSVCLFVCLSVCLLVCLSVCLFVCLSVCLFVFSNLVRREKSESLSSVELSVPRQSVFVVSLSLFILNVKSSLQILLEASPLRFEISFLKNKLNWLVGEKIISFHKYNIFYDN